MLILEKSKIGVYTANCNNKYLHSKYNPINESKVFIRKYKNLFKAKVVIIYGLGLGYHVQESLKYINSDTIIYIFEGNQEIINVCKEVNFSLFTNKSIKIISSNNINFYNILSNKLKQVDDIIIHRPSLESIKIKNHMLYKLINDYRISKESVKKYGKLLNENYQENLKLNCKSIKKLILKYKKVNKTYVIIAAGPSLDSELDLLKKNRDKFIIISVGSAFRTLMNKCIKPDIVVIIDGQEIVSKQLKGYEKEDIPLCFLSTASRWAVKSYKGPKYIFFNNKEESDIIIHTGKTVAVAAISIALKCNAKEIILLGQDLAYINGKSHTNMYEKIYGNKDNPIINEKSQLIKGVDGRILKTTKGYIYFKQQIEKIIKDNKSTYFINCSKGAIIQGAKHIELKKYLD